MSKVTCISGIGKPVVVDGVTTAIFETPEGTPIAVVTETVPGGYALIPATDPDFNRIISGLGLDRVEVAVQSLVMPCRSNSSRRIAELN